MYLFQGSTGNLGIGLQVKDNSVIVTEIYKDGPVHKHGKDIGRRSKGGLCWSFSI